MKRITSVQELNKKATFDAHLHYLYWETFRITIPKNPAKVLKRIVDRAILPINF